MEVWYRVKSSVLLPGISFALSMLFLMVAKRVKPVIGLAGCALVPILLCFFMPVVPFAFFFGLLPALILLVGILMWCAPTRPRSATKALLRTAACGLLPCAATYYVFITTDCIHMTNGGCDDPLILWGSAVACSWPLGTVVSALISTGRDVSVPWER
jgi:hypothetical protein